MLNFLFSIFKAVLKICFNSFFFKANGTQKEEFDAKNRPKNLAPSPFKEVKTTVAPSPFLLSLTLPYSLPLSLSFLSPPSLPPLFRNSKKF
jgi:hypothetical protein